jgi:integrase
MKRHTRKQSGQRFETNTAFWLRVYRTMPDGQRKKTSMKIAEKSEQFKSWADVEHLVATELDHINGGEEGPRTLAEFVEQVYFPWADQNLSAATVYGYRQIWNLHWLPTVGPVAINALETVTVTRILTALAQKGLSGRTLSHIKWMLSGVYEYAVPQGLAAKNPVIDAQWMCKVARVEKPPEYSLEQVLAMLKILEPIDIRAAVAVALAYFAALRPAEIRGLRWEDYGGAELHIRRSIWRQRVGETKTQGSAASVPVIEPLRGLLARLGDLYGRGGYIMQSIKHTPLDLNSLNNRVISPALDSAGIAWAGFYPARRGISSLVTDTSKNALNSTGLLRHSTPITALKHYTRAQKESIRHALEQVEEMATKGSESAH